jgi:DNA-binding NarL/FixJ family response regulator
MIEAGMIAIALLDPHPIVRAGILGILALDSALTVVAEAESEASAVALLRLCAADVLLIDGNIALRDRAKAVARFRSEFKTIRIVVMCVIAEPSARDGALAAGASAVCWKDASADEILQAVRPGPAVLTDRKYGSGAQLPAAVTAADSR